MSDDERIKSLIVDVIHSMSNDMAIHIEELEAENMGLRLELQLANDAADEAIERAKKLEAKLANCEIYRDAYDNIGKNGAKYIEELEAKLHKTELKLEYATQELKAIEDEPNDPLAPLVMKTIAKFAISELENEDRWVDPKENTNEPNK
jgi:archaellum component FlaC